MKKNKYSPESGEEALAALIKEAGEEARKRKKKAMDEHAAKLHDAVRGRVPVVMQTE